MYIYVYICIYKYIFTGSHAWGHGVDKIWAAEAIGELQVATGIPHAPPPSLTRDP